MKLTDFDIYKDLLKKQSGLVVNQEQSSILNARLSPVARKWGYPSLESMTIALQGVPDKALLDDIVEAMMNYETSFIRDTKIFSLFETDVLPYFHEARQEEKSLNIWSAGASTGQEPYSLAIALYDTFPNWNFNITATDISNEILVQAREGIYSKFEVQRGLPVEILLSNFKQINDGWQIKNEIKDMVHFERFNLLDDMEKFDTFDVIFCRNILSTFDEETKTDVLNRTEQKLANDGFLFLGKNETVLGFTDNLVPLPEKNGVYVKKKGPHI